MTIPPMVTDRREARGVAMVMGMKSARRGTETRASPNPNVERINVAANTTSKTYHSAISQCSLLAEILISPTGHNITALFFAVSSRVAGLRVDGRAFGNQFYFKNPGPELAGYEEAVACGVIGNAVENSFRVGDGAGRKQAGEIDPADDISGGRGDAGDAVLVPDVRVDFTVDVFELVQLVDGGAVVGDGDAADFIEGSWIEKVEI